MPSDGRTAASGTIHCARDDERRTRIAVHCGVADERIVGYCDVSPIPRKAAPHVGELGIAIVPDWRGKGIGRSLMMAALEGGWRHGFSRIQLSVYANNVRALALYRKMGFVQEGVMRRSVQIDGVYFDEIMMAQLATEDASPT
ncbi:MAG: GNAT family N-acetyltransferase [Hyphomicrobiaceae bacterium]